MATYVPNATQTSEPVESQTVESAALEFRTLKTRVNSLETAVNMEDTRDLRVPEAAIAAVPAIASRAGKVLGFDAAGDPVVVEISGATDPSLRAALAASSGASLVGYMPTGVGAVSRDLESKLSESIFGTAYDFMTDLEISDALGETSSGSDHSAAFQKAADRAVITGDFCIPDGNFKITQPIYVGVTAGGIVLRDYINIRGMSKGTTFITSGVTSAPIFYVSNANFKMLSFLGRGKSAGFADTAISYHTGATVRDICIEDIELDNFGSAGIRLSSAYNGRFARVRAESCTDGIVFDTLGPWELGTTTFLLETVYVGACGTGITTEGNSVLTCHNVTAENNNIGLNISGVLIAKKLYRELNTSAGVYARNMLGYQDTYGTKQTAGDADDITFYTGVRGVVTENAAPRQDITTTKLKKLGYTYYEDTTRLWPVMDAKGTNAGLRNKYPQAKMTPSVRCDLFVKVDGSVLTDDAYGLTVTKTGTGTYSIAWGTVFDVGVTEARLPIVSVSPVAGVLVGTAAARIACWQYVGANVGAYNVATSIKVLTYDTAGALTDCAFTASLDFRFGANTGSSLDFNEFGRDTTA